ncbi:DUF2550 family protein [Brachybacterium sp. J144]|uniref:DUF2550 family protein n=1 Tax=Brachybacterium sp. J144 TaxID=3116487 RepID=UPI002E7A7F48|nr:DUF2550 family protein [Brachybacterium sp. J144]MEE1649734.1 DUF2550 family protein [Brachybacterium sp. J144]
MNHVSIPILLLGIGMLVVLAAGAIVLRHVGLSRQRGAFDCTLWRSAWVGGPSWQHGMMRFGPDRLRWFRAFSLRLGPEVVIRREEILDVRREFLPPQLDGEPERCLLEFSLLGERRLRAVVDRVSGAAMTSWLEAAPTGMVLGDAD